MPADKSSHIPPDCDKAKAAAHERIRFARECAVHGGLYGVKSYIPHMDEPNIVTMLATLLQLHREGTLTEGQVSRATGLDRVSVRKFCDAIEEREEAARSAIQRAEGGQ